MTGANWKPHGFRVGQSEQWFDEAPADGAVENCRRSIEPWLSAVFQTEHLSLLVGSGFATGLAAAADGEATGMEMQECDCAWAAEVESRATASAEQCGRGTANIEDQIRAVLELVRGLEVMGRDVGEVAEEAAELKEKVEADAETWAEMLDGIFREFISSILETERVIRDAPGDRAETVHRVLVSFLLSFASRAASRERLNVFTTNYDRLLEYASDLAGIRTLDRFVGGLTPVFRSSRVDVDLHYNPPGIRGEPRYLEGVIRLTKLHGSIDWRWEGRQLRRYGIPFGAATDHPDVLREPLDSVMIYPNPAKDIDTLYYPYAELFRDLSAAICRPNSALVTYGYGFGDDHVNRIIKDMLTIPSTHLVIISYDDAGGRVSRFCSEVGRPAQVSLLMGEHFGRLDMLVDHYLPKPAIDPISWRKTELLERRGGAYDAAGEVAAREPDEDQV